MSEIKKDKDCIINQLYRISNEGWEKHHLNKTCIEIYPQEMITRLIAEFFDKGYELVDLGSSYGKNSLSFANRFKKVKLIDPFISQKNLNNIEAFKNSDNTEHLPILINSFADLTKHINRNTIILATYFFDHMPKKLALKILNDLINNRNLYSCLISSFFINNGYDYAEIKTSYDDHYIKPINDNQFSDLKVLSKYTNQNKKYLNVLESSKVPIEMHTYFDKNEIIQSYSKKESIQIYTTNINRYIDKNLDNNRPEVAAKILYIKS